jgi:hypothetical protein
MLIIFGTIFAFSYYWPFKYLDNIFGGDELSSGIIVFFYGSLMAFIMLGTSMFWIPLSILAGVACLSYILLDTYVIHPQESYNEH